jgi:hypothetical protein
MNVNLNVEVIAILTEQGARIYNAYWSVQQIPKEHRPLKLDKGDEIRVQLWHLMQLFGNHIYNGMPEVPFMNNEIKILK